MRPQAHCIYNTTLQDNTGNEQVTFQAFLSRQGRKIFPIKQDGNCLFRSLAALLTGNQEDHLMLRNMFVDLSLQMLTCLPPLSSLTHFKSTSMLLRQTMHGGQTLKYYTLPDTRLCSVRHPPRWMLESVQTIEMAHFHTLCCWEGMA